MSRWDFDVERNGSGERWSWRRTEWDLSAETSAGSFATFSDCLADAAKHGYTSQAVVVVNSRGEERQRPAAH